MRQKRQTKTQCQSGPVVNPGPYALSGVCLPYFELWELPFGYQLFSWLPGGYNDGLFSELPGGCIENTGHYSDGGDSRNFSMFLWRVWCV
jgi:hypothetical protein